jgi:thiamine-phosphate pyrophosphorylase
MAPQRLYLVTPRLDDPTPFVGVLDGVLAAGDIAAVLLRFAAADERVLIDRAKTVGAVVQRRDVALVLDGHADIAARAGADGAHLTGIEAFAAALSLLKPDRIAGAGGLRSRHDAMLAGEAGADYAMFGEPAPDAREGAGRRPPFDVILEHLTWWADLLEIPCIGYAGGMDEIAPLARTGADFIALGEWIWLHPQGSAAIVREAAEHLGAPAS